MENQNYCENCKFYNKLYSIFAARLVYANCGTCKNSKINTNTARKTVNKKLPCEYFEQAENEPPISAEKLQKTFCQIKQRLEDIALILNLK